MSLNPYQKAGYGQGNVGIGKKPAILVVDFQKAFTSIESPLGGSELITSAVQKTKELISLARQENLPIIHTVVGYRQDKKDMGHWPLKVPTLSEVTLGSKWVEIDEELEVKEEDIIIVKKMPSAFFNTDLTNILISNQIDTVIISGCTTSGCIRATAIDSFSYGFRTIIAEECVGDQGIEPHRANLFDIQNRYGDILKNNQIISHFTKVLR
ncbi:isochorismatase family protein [Neobacillus niacini]|uniref:isochorismatase family protein n=1 Tax=Neobacillus niacini TaxID=86668 RepID=UPI0007ABEACC|nr:isochorismatase family protein [Neobacillus niacini]MEC1525420.1 isochorismatase family protein [Neobacillus niacini]